MRKNPSGTTGNVEPPQPTRLRIERNKALAQLQDRIEEGERLLARYTAPDADAARLAGDKTAWQEINIVQLRQMFTTTEYLDQYERQSTHRPPSNFRMFAVAGPSRPQRPQPAPEPGPSPQALVQRALNCLRSVQNQIVHIEEELPKTEAPQPRSQPQSIYVHNMHNSAIQQGTHGSNQTITVRPHDFDSIADFVQQVKQYLDLLPLDAEAKQDVSAQIATVEGQLKSPKPNRLIVTESIKAMEASLETVRGNVVADGMLQKMLALLTGVQAA